MLDWNDLRYVLALHRAATLARAGSTLGIDPTTVGRRIAALEEQIGARLFDRTPAGYALTPAGHDLLPRALTMEDQALALERELAGADRRVAGVVRLAVTEMLATRFLAPHLARLTERHPALTLDLRCGVQAVSLSRREADLALRLARPREPDVVAKRLGDIHQGLYAARGYLAKRGRPSDPERSLAGHDVILFADTRAFRAENEWMRARTEGANIVLRSDSVSSMYSAAVNGHGVALLPTAVADADENLEKLPTRTPPIVREIWRAAHRDVLRSARVRAVADFLEDALGAAPGRGNDGASPPRIEPRGRHRARRSGKR